MVEPGEELESITLDLKNPDRMTRVELDLSWDFER